MLGNNRALGCGQPCAWKNRPPGCGHPCAWKNRSLKCGMWKSRTRMWSPLCMKTSPTRMWYVKIAHQDVVTPVLPVHVKIGLLKKECCTVIVLTWSSRTRFNILAHPAPPRTPTYNTKTIDDPTPPQERIRSPTPHHTTTMTRNAAATPSGGKRNNNTYVVWYGRGVIVLQNAGHWTSHKAAHKDADAPMPLECNHTTNIKDSGFEQLPINEATPALLFEIEYRLCVQISRVGQNRIYTTYMTVYLVVSLPKIPYTHRIYIWFWPTLQISVLAANHLYGVQLRSFWSVYLLGPIGWAAMPGWRPL